MRRRGAPARKDGPRTPSGRLRHTPSIDQGHDEARAKRALLVGTARADDPRAGYPLGVLLMTGCLADDGMSGEAANDQARERHDAGLRYAADHAIVFGQTTPQSHLANLIATSRSKAPDTGDSKFQLNAADRYGRKVAAVRLLPPPSNPFPFHILERIAIDESYDLTPAELDALRRALAAIVPIR
jgi:hypothetical protein